MNSTLESSVSALRPDRAHFPLNLRSRWLIVVVFAIAMAWLEAAVVFYLRTLVDRIQPYQPYPLPVAGGLGAAELIRELATLVMLLTVGILAGKSWRGRVGFTAVAFGVWDIFYYVFLKPLCGWPASLTDWDILFLLPLPWWGPVIAPVGIAVLMIAWGTLVNICEERGLPATGYARTWVIGAGGILLALYVFMADAIQVAGQGAGALRDLLPSRFNWGLFVGALLLMAVPAIHLTWRLARRSQGASPTI